MDSFYYKVVQPCWRHVLLLASILACRYCLASVIYVSSSLGSDDNSGVHPSTPLRSLKNAISNGDTIFLKSGDTFYEGISINNKYLSVYGGKRKPVICGYKRVASCSWEIAGKKLWKIGLKGMKFTGNGVSNSSSFLNNIGCIHEYDKDLVHGRKVQFKQELTEDWDFWQTEHYTRIDTEPEDFDTLYLYLEEDPNNLKLEFSVGTTGIFVRNSMVEELRIEGFGCHGIAGKSNTFIRKCEIDAIGGMTQIGYKNYVCLGNGIEFFVSESIENCSVEECRISRCYDCGATIQGARSGQATPSNIFFRNNLIYDCCQGWEDFLNNDENVFYQNCVFENNIVLNSGKTNGFNYSKRFKFCHVLGNSLKGYKGMIIKKNLFVGGNYYVGGNSSVQFKSNIWVHNVCYIKRGDFILSNYDGSKDVIRIPTERGVFKTLREATNKAIRKYREMTGDKTTRFVIQKEEKINKRIKRLSKKYL